MGIYGYGGYMKEREMYDRIASFVERGVLEGFSCLEDGMLFFFPGGGVQF